MVKYLSYGNFEGDGIKGLTKEGGSSRVAAVKKLFRSVSETLECCYYALGVNTSSTQPARQAPGERGEGLRVRLPACVATVARSACPRGTE
jgi:hypothetical protein